MEIQQNRSWMQGRCIFSASLVLCMLLTFMGLTVLAATISPDGGTMNSGKVSFTTANASDLNYTEKDVTWTISDNTLSVKITGDNEYRPYSTAIAMASTSGVEETFTISYKVGCYAAYKYDCKVLINGVVVFTGNIDDDNWGKWADVSGTTSDITLPADGSPVYIEVYTDQQAASYTDLFLTFNFSATGASVTFQPGDTTKGTYSVTDADGKVHSVTQNTAVSVPDSGVTLKATPANGYKLIGWKDASTHKYIHYVPEYQSGANTVFTVSDPCSVYPVFIPSSQVYIFELISAGTKYYTWEDAFRHVSATDTVRLLTSTTLPQTLAGNGLTTSTDYVVSTDGIHVSEYRMLVGQKLLIPYTATDAGKWSLDTEPDESSSRTRPSVFRTLTVPVGVKIVCNGAINANAVQATSSPDSNTGGTNGAYGHIKLESGAELVLNDGALFLCYGYVTGNGKVVANSGATVCEFFEIADWRGGSAMTAWNSDKIAFPLSQYYIQNIEAKYEMHAGMESHIWTGMNVSSSNWQFKTLFIGTESGLFQLGTNGVLLRQYDAVNDRIVYDVYEDIVAGAINITVEALGTQMDLNSGLYQTPINNNMTIRIMNGGYLTVSKTYKMLPNSHVDIQPGGTMEIASGVYLAMYDYNHWKDMKLAYNGQNVRPVYYSATKGAASSRTMSDTSASINVDGDLIIHGNLYTTTKVSGYWPTMYLASSGWWGYNWQKSNGSEISSSTIDATKAITGNGQITNDAAFSSTTFSEMYQWVSKIGASYVWTDTQALQKFTITCAPAIGNIAGASSNPSAFAAGTAESPVTYHGLGKDHSNTWYINSSRQNPTCLNGGYDRYWCTDSTKYLEVSIAALGHTEVTDAAVAPTCTETGLTEGCHCSVCSEVLTAQEVIAAKGHTKVIDPAVAPTCTETGLTEGCHCDVCGEVITAQKVVAMLEHIYDYHTRIVLGDSLDVQFAFSACWFHEYEDDGLSGCYVSLIKTFADNRGDYKPESNDYLGFKVLPDKWASESIGGWNYYYVTFSDVAGKEMCDTITLKLMNSTSQVGLYTDSIRDYAMRLLNARTYSDEVNTMLVDLLHYGAAAQTYYGYGTGDLANAKIDSKDISVSIANNANIGTSFDAAKAGARFELTNEICLHFTCIGLTENMTANISFTNRNGEYVVTSRTDNRMWYFNLADAGMTIADARCLVTITVLDADGNTFCTITDSMESYVARVIAGGAEGVKHSQDDFENLVALLQRVMMFADSVTQYADPWSTAPQEVGS